MNIEVTFGNQQKVFVSHVANSTFFVQLETNEAYALGELSQRIQSHIESGARKKLDPDFGIQCCAFSNADQTWYRALISEVKGSKVTVYYVDYGNTEQLPCENLSLPIGSFFETPYQAVCCTIGDFFPFQGRSASSHLADTFASLLLNQEFSGVFRSRSSAQVHPFLSVLPCYNIHLFQGEGSTHSIASSLVEQGLGQYAICAENIEIGSKQNVYTCFVDSPGKFWVQLSSKVDFLQAVMDDLNAPETVSSLKRLPSTALVPGVACCTQFSEDERYYRAEIVSVSSSRVEVCFVDYGNCESVEQSSVFQIPVQLAQAPFCAIQCCLEGVKPIKPSKPDPKLGSIAWNTKSCDKLIELTEERELEAHFVAEISPEIFSVHLTDVENQLHVGEMLAEARVAEYSTPNLPTLVPSKDLRYLSLEVGETYKNVFISFAESPAVVWCQRPEYTTELGELASSLAEKGPTMPVIQNPVVDQTCCVQYTLDQSWCRGVVQSVDQQSGTAQVLFVDYGNVETINLSEVKSLLPEFYTLPAQAISFSMAEISPRSGDAWSEAAIAAFQGLAYEQTLHVKVLGYDQDSYPSAKLFDPLNNNKDVGLELVTLGHAKIPWNTNTTRPGNEKNQGRNEAIELVSQIATSQQQPSHSRKNSDSSSSQSQNFRSFSNEKKPSSPYHSQEQSPYHGDRYQSKKTSPYQSHRESPFHSPKESSFHSQNRSPRDSSPSSPQRYNRHKLDDGQAYNVIVCHVETLGEFYCHLSSEVSKLNELMGKIHKNCNSRSTKTVRSPQVGMPVLALFSEDRVWYRARINNQPNQSGGIEVVFADYGNTETVSQKSVAQIPPYFLSIPAQAIQCSLFGVPNDTTPSEKAIDAFGELTIDQNFQLRVKQNSNDVVVAELISPDNSSILNHLIKSGHLPHVSPSKGQQQQHSSVPLPHILVQEHLDVVPSYIESPSSFCLQLTDSYTGLEKLSNDLNEVYQQLATQDKKLNRPECGQFCAARFSEDGLWYRARITTIVGPQKCEVCYIDYGNSEAVSVADLKELVPEFAKLPCFGISCSLNGLPASSATSPGVCEQFSQLVTDKQLVAHFQKPATAYGETVPVKLMDTSQSGLDVDITQAILRGGQETKRNPGAVQVPSITIVMNSPMECFITFVNSPGEFYSQLASEKEPIDNLLNKMYAFYEEQNEGTPLSTLSVGSYCAALYSDGSWYRGSITSLTPTGAVVFYVDFGNTNEVESSNLRTLDPQFFSMPTQALKCSLSNLSPLSTNWSDDCITTFNSLVLEQTLQVSFLNQNAGGSYETLLLLTGEDVAQKLCEAGVAQRQGDATCIKEGAESGVQTLTVPAYPVKTGTKYDAFVTSVSSPVEFYCQIIDPEEKLDQLMVEIEVYCRKTRPASPTKSYSWKPGDFALALFSEDETWYRATVTKVLKGGIIVEVHYIDYGNNEMVSQSQLIPLKQDFCALPSQAIKCRLEGSQYYTYNKESLDKFSELLLNQEFEVKCVSLSSNNTCGVDLNRKSDDVDMMSLVIQEKIVTPQQNDVCQPSAATVRQSDKGEMEITALFPSDVASDSYHDVTVVHVEDPSLFYCQFSLHTTELLESLMTKMQEFYTAGKGRQFPANKPKKGLFVAAQYSGDERWYRAVVNEVTSEGVSVTFVDYGNSEVVALPVVQQLSAEYTQLPAQAIPCSLADVGPLGDSWSDEVIAIFLDLVLEKTLVAQVKSFRNLCSKPYIFGDGQTLLISLIESSEEIASKLVEMGLVNNTALSLSATPSISTTSSSQDPSSGSVFKFLNLSVGDTCEMYVSNADSPSAFWLQLPSADDKLPPLQDKLSAYGSSEAQILGKPTPGSICCAKFSTDGSWYRSVVKSVLPNGIHVCFMDYGNSEVVAPSDVKVLLPEFLELPIQAVECKLSNCDPPQGETTWSDGATTAFMDLTTDKVLTVAFVCKMYNTWDVNLFDGEVDIASQLVQNGLAVVPSNEGATTEPEPIEIPRLDLEVGHTYPVYIAFNDTPSKFYCQLVSECDKLESLMAEIADFYNGNHLEPLLEVGAYCVAQYSGNCAWYRARVTAFDNQEDIEVHFIDYGNSEHVSGNQILALCYRFASLPAQAFCCSLIRNLELEFSPEALELFFSYDLNQEFRVNVTSIQDGRYVVDLFDQGGSLINASLLKTEVPQPLPQPQVPLPSQPAAYTPLSYSVGTKVDVYISHIASPTSFYCQPLDLAADLDNMMTEVGAVMSSESPTPLPLAELASGKVCVAQYSADNEWYRATVEEIISENEVLVTFVDYGNAEVTTLEHVARLPSKFLSTPLQAIHCSVFEGLRAEMEWNDDQVAEFQSLIPENEQHNLKITELSQNGQYSVEVSTNGERKDFSALLEQRFDHSATIRSEQAPLKESIPPAVHTNELPLMKPTSNLSTLALKGSQTPSVGGLESGSENGETETDASEGKPLIRAPFKLSLAVQEVLEVNVVFTQSPSLLYIQRTDCQGELFTLSDEIQQYCASFDNLPSHQTFHKGDFVLAKYVVDEAWYRAEVLGVDLDGTAKVHFIDYGNEEVISPENLIMCPENFLELPVQAIPCSLSQVPARDSWPTSYKEFIDSLVDDKALRVTVVLPGSQGMRPTINLEDLETGIDISQKVLAKLQEECESGSSEIIEELPEGEADAELLELHEEEDKEEEKVGGIVEEVAVSDEGLLSVQESNLPRRDFSVRGTLEVYMISCSSPHSFVCQLASEAEVLDSITTHLSQLYTYQEDSTAEQKYTIRDTPKEGDLVVGQFSEDGQWYRAKILAVNEGVFEVQYIDFGNCESLLLESMRYIDPSLITYPPQAIECYLNGIEMPSEEGQFNQLAAEKMQELVGENSCVIEIVSIDTAGQLGVTLTTANQLSVGAALIEGKLASPLVPSVETTPSTLISPEVAPASADEHSLGGNMEAFHEPEEPVPPQDISTVLHEQSTVSDQTEYTAVDEVVEPVADEPKVPVENGTEPEDESVVYATSFSPRNLVQGSRYKIEVTFVATLEEFVCRVLDYPSEFQHLQDDIASRNYQLGTTDELSVTTPKLHMPLCACSPKDDVWYRAECVGSGRETDSIKVRYVDLGTTETLALKRVKRLEKGFASALSPLSVKCRLPILTEYDMNPKLKLEGEPWELMWPISSIRHFSELTTSGDKSGGEGELCAEIIETDSDGSYLVNVMRCAPNEKDVNIRDLLVAKLQEPKILTFDNASDLKDDSLQLQDGDSVFEDPLADSEVLRATERELASATPPPTECMYEVSTGGDTVSLRTTAPTPRSLDHCEPTERAPTDKEPAVEGVMSEAVEGCLPQISAEVTTDIARGDSPGNMEVFLPSKTSEVVELPKETQQQLENLDRAAATTESQVEEATPGETVFDANGSELSGKEEGFDEEKEIVDLKERDSDSCVDRLEPSGAVNHAALQDSCVLADDNGPLKATYDTLQLHVDLELQLLYIVGTSPADFTCQPFETCDLLATLMDQIKEHIDSGGASSDSLVSVKPGEPVLAQFSEDCLWYRGEVLTFDPENDTAEVLFVDYGNSEHVRLVNVHKIPQEFLQLPKQAVVCSLSGIKPVTEDGVWGSGALEKLEELANACEFVTACVVGLDSHLVQVQLKTDSCLDFAKELVACKLAC